MLQTIDDKMEIAERYYADKITMRIFKLLRLAVLKSEVEYLLFQTDGLTTIYIRR